MVHLASQFAAVDGRGFESDWVEGALVPLLEDDRFGEVWLIEEEDRALGHAIVGWGYSVESGGRDALLDEIFMTETGTGGGSALLEQVNQRVRDQGISVLYLETEHDNEAPRRLYRRHGFVEQDSIWMTLELR